MIPEWLALLATACVSLALLCAAIEVVLLVSHPQKMWIMDVVWPVTALYWGPASLWGLWAWGVPPAKLRGPVESRGVEKPFWQQIAVSATHCGAGCVLGDLIGEWLVFAFGWKLFGDQLYAEFLVDFPLAYLLGIMFQYFTIAPMRGLELWKGIVAAVEADTVSILAFEVGLFGWMAFDAFVLFPGESIASWNHWFQMQIGMIVGFLTSYPANGWLLKEGLKEPM
jgi:hypothetical protein